MGLGRGGFCRSRIGVVGFESTFVALALDAWFGCSQFTAYHWPSHTSNRFFAS
jgi:hypothetical protein